MPSAIASPSPSPLSPLSNVLQIEKSFPTAAGLVLGDLLEATVLQNLESGKLLVSLNGSDAIRADSAVALRAGETITVKVEQLRPSIVLSLVSQALPEERISEYLRLQRANPEALLKMISELPQLLDSKNLVQVMSFLNQNKLKSVLTILKSLPLTPQTIGTDFFKSYIEKLGLQWESSLKQALKSGDIDIDKSGLKGALIKLSEEFKALAEKGNLFNGNVLNDLKAVEKMTAASIKTIESDQVLNVLSQQNDNRYLFQIPMLFPSGVSRADICVHFEDKGRKKPEETGFRVLFLLNMDALGDIAVEASLYGKLLNCRIQCTDQESCTFISGALKGLKESLTGLGFRIESIDCRFEKDLSEVQQNFNRMRLLEDQDAVNIYI